MNDHCANRPIFVVGCPRSGTTLLQLMLHSHPRIAVPPETRFVLEAYSRRREFGDLQDRLNRKALAHWIVRRKESKFRDLGLERRAVSSEIRRGPRTLGSALGIVFRAYARRFDKPRWGDKRPAYYQNVDVLLRLFPDAQFIHLIRDGRDCVGSLKQMDWYRHDFYTAVSTWAEAVDYGRANARRLGPDTFYELRYEDLTADPDTELKALCAFLGEDFDPAMCEPHRIAEVAVPERKAHHSNTRREVTTALSNRWQERLEPWEAGLAELVLGSRLRSHGYELDGVARPGAGHVARYVRTAAGRRVSWYRRRLGDWRRRWREPTPDLAAQLEGYPPPPAAEG